MSYWNEQTLWVTFAAKVCVMDASVFEFVVRIQQELMTVTSFNHGRQKFFKTLHTIRVVTKLVYSKSLYTDV